MKSSPATIRNGTLLITTTPAIRGWRIIHYIGLVGGEAFIGANMFVRDMLRGVRDLIGGRSDSYERALVEARESASVEIRKRAWNLGGNAIVSAAVNYEVINDILMVSISGTAVRIEPEPDNH
jgi:uncharacterized protein YbjQ (UPF0145 family)